MGEAFSGLGDGHASTTMQRRAESGGCGEQRGPALLETEALEGEGTEED